MVRHALGIRGVALHEAAHAVLLRCIFPIEMPEFLSIVARGNTSGVVRSGVHMWQRPVGPAGRVPDEFILADKARLGAVFDEVVDKAIIVNVAGHVQDYLGGAHLRDPDFVKPSFFAYLSQLRGWATVMEDSGHDMSHAVANAEVRFLGEKVGDPWAHVLKLARYRALPILRRSQVRRAVAAVANALLRKKELDRSDLEGIPALRQMTQIRFRGAKRTPSRP